MQEMTTEEKTQLRKIEISILDFVVNICERNSLRYYLAYGTLLGAVRHKGFIPWDDDIDIFLPRNDYEKLCLFLKEQCDYDSGFYYQDYHSDFSFRYPFSKVRKRDTVFLEDDSIFEDAEQGIFIDIFPLDVVKHKIGFQKIFSYLIYRLLKYEKKQNGHKTKLADKLMKHYKSGSFYVVYGSPYKVEKDIHEVVWFGTGTEVEFEGKNYTGPANVDAYLTQLYDDYMKIPPEDKMVTHNPKQIIFKT